MRVAELRKRLIDKVEQAATYGDEAAATLVLTNARAALIALAGRPEDEEVSLQDMTVGTYTAALILGMHREYVRMLVRTGQLKATKDNGEHQLLLSDVMEYLTIGSKLDHVKDLMAADLARMLSNIQ